LVKNIRIIANVDNDRFHVLIGKSHQMHVKNHWKYIQQKRTHFAKILAFPNYRFPIKNQNMFIVYLNVYLHISIWIFIGAVKKVCGKFLFFNGFSDMMFSLTTSWIISDKSKNQGISEKPLKQRNFPHTFFYRADEDSNCDI
jgi:hypothetical protein